MGFDLPSLLEQTSRICFVSTVLLNGTLIYLTAFHTKHIVGTYRRMIITFAIIGIIFSTLDILVRPLIHSYNGCFIYFSLGSSFRHSKTATEIGLLIYCGFYSMILAFLAVQFVYRACVIMKQVPEWTKYFDGGKYVISLGYTLLGGIIWIFASILVYPDEVTLAYVRSEVLQNYGVEIKNVPHFAVLAYNREGETKTVRWKSVQCIGTVVALMTLQYSIILVSGVVMYRRTQGKRVAASSQHEQMQKQFFIALIYQVVAPTLFFQLPGFFVLVSPFFDMKFSFHSGRVPTLIVLKVITEYKNAWKRFVSAIAGDCLECFGGHTPREPPPTSISLQLAKL